MTALLDDLRGLSATLGAERVDRGGQDRAADAGRVEAIAAMEQLKSALCAAQADLAVALDASVRAQHAAAGVPAACRGRGVGAQVALARQESPHRGQVLLGLAKDLAVDLPHTAAALREGTLRRVPRDADRPRVGVPGPRAARLPRRGPLCTRAGRDPVRRRARDRAGRDCEVRRRVAAIDPAAVVRRQRRAETERRLSLRPAPETMAYLTGLLPMVQAIATHLALGKEADRLRSEGDPRSKGQLMADLMITRLTGQATATGVPVTVDVVLSDQSLLGAGHEPATIPGWGPVPAQIAREAIARATEDLGAWIRRLYTDPAGHLHGLCEACNHTKQAPGWTQDVIDDLLARHTVQTTTPTGHRHRSRAPTPPTPAPGSAPPRRLDIEWRLLERLGHAA